MGLLYPSASSMSESDPACPSFLETVQPLQINFQDNGKSASPSPASTLNDTSLLQDNVLNPAPSIHLLCLDGSSNISRQESAVSTVSSSYNDTNETSPLIDELGAPSDPELSVIMTQTPATIKEATGTKRKRLREKGMPYVCHGIERPARQMKAACDCSSKATFCQDFTSEDRQRCFEQVWDMSWDEKKAFILGLVDKIPKHKKYTENDTSRRDFTFVYHLKKGGMRTKVCQTMFSNTTALSKRFVYMALHCQEETSNISLIPHRRSHSYYDRGTVDKQFLKEEFLDKLPKLPSHYCRSSSSKVYLERCFSSLAEVHRLYKELCVEKNMKHLGYDVFHQMFADQNLSLFKPKKDQCDICVGYEAGNVPRDNWDKHQQKKEAARNEKASDKERAIKKDPSDRVCVACMDLQCVLLTPSLKASALYYKTKLAVHNFTLYDLATREVDCYLWHEGEGGLTANEFSTCITHYISSKANNFKHFILFSDGCTYQNRNAILGSALSALARELNITIEQKYLAKGHTQMEVDSVHSVIERALKNTAIYVPSDYALVMRSARQKPMPYTVHQLDHTFFKDHAKVGEYKTIRPGRSSGDATVTDIQALRYTPDSMIAYKLNFNDEWLEIPRPRRQPDSLLPPPLYTHKLRIKKSKYKHLQELKSVMPSDYHAFYDSLDHD